MKSIFILMFAVLIACLSACQATPEKSHVVQKDMQQMIDKAQAASSKGADTRSLKEQLNVPDALKEELTSAQGKLKIHVNADVVVPDAAAIPAAAIGMGTFTQDDVQRLYKTLCGDALPVKADLTEETKAEKMREIQPLLDQKKSGKLDDMKYDSMAELDAAIKKAMQEASNLPDHFERVEPDFSFHTEGTDAVTAHLRVAPDDATVSDLTVINCTQGASQNRAEYYRDLFCYAELSNVLVDPSGAFIETESKYFKPPAMKEDAARKLADDTINSLGLKDFTCLGRRISALYNPGVDADNAARTGVYEYMYTRQIGGVPVTYTNDAGNEFDNEKGGKAAYSAPWMYEKVRIIIDDKGILAFLWNSPYVVKNTVTNSSAMLPFENIKNTFDKMIPVVNNIYDTSSQGLTCDMYVTQVKLGLMRVTEKDIGTSGLVIPVWDFFGYTKDSNGSVNGKDGYNSLLTINAIDGSIIDRGLGY